MRSFFTPGLALIGLVALLVSGCGGGGGSSSAPRAGTSSKTTYTVKITLPTSGSATSSVKRKIQYVSPSLQSIVVALRGAQNQQLVQGNDYLNITATGSASNGDCQTNAGVVTCTLSLNAAIGSGGSFTVVVATYDAQQTAACLPRGTPACSGNLLSITDMPQSVTPGQTLSLTLGGIPAYLQPLELVCGYVSGVGGALSLYGAGPQQVKFSFLDADKNMIVGSGAPNLSLTSSNTSKLQASVATVAGSGIYTLTFNPQTVMALGVPVVQPAVVPVQFTVGIPNTTMSVSVNVPFTIKHSVMYVAANNPSVPGTTTIFAYFDGNTTPSWNVYDTGNTVNIATDMSGNIWGADEGNDKIVEFDANPNSPPNENDPAIPSNYYPEYIAFDANGNGYVGNCGKCHGLATTFDEFNAPNPQSSPNFSAVGTNLFSDVTVFPYGLTVDALATVYFSYLQAGQWKLNSVPVGPATTSLNQIPALAIDPLTGFVWFANDNGYAYLMNQASSIVITLPNPALSPPVLGLATDQIGNLYIPNYSGGGVVMLAPPSYSSSVTLAPALTNVTGVAVFPNQIIGQQAPVGIPPSPMPSPTPLPTPT
jgi:hypothetical protein